MRKLMGWVLGLSAACLAVQVVAAEYKVPRLSDGAPDLQGNWTNASATPIERPAQFGNRRALSKEEADAITKRELDRVAADAKPADPNEKQEAGALPPVGNYNLFWTERGMSPTLINGEYRTSVIIDPPDGHFAPFKKEAMERRAARRVKTESAADGPEQRSLGERCILSFGSAAGPPMLPTMYNSNYAIFQSPGYVVIMAEMVHDARVIRISDKHTPDSIKKWTGDSIGRWEGDTLVIETRNMRPEQSFRGASEKAVFTERLTRVAKDKIVYRFTIDDPDTFTAPTTGELAFEAYPFELFEYACHEGNYGLPGILAGERELEKAKLKAQKEGAKK